MLWPCERYVSVNFSQFYTEFFACKSRWSSFHHLFIACKNELCNWQIERWMKATFSRIKNTLFCPQFSPQNAENRILGLWNFKLFWVSTPPDPLLLPRKRGLMAPCWYSRLLYSNLLATSIFIETTASGFPWASSPLTFYLDFLFFVHYHGKTINWTELSIHPYLQEWVPLPLETNDNYTYTQCHK